MKKLNTIKKFEDFGFIVVKNVLNKYQINKLLDDLENVKKKVILKPNQYFHKTSDNKFNTIHNIQKFHKKKHNRSGKK